MPKPSDAFTATKLYQESPQLQAIYARYALWTPDHWSIEQMSFDMGYLMGALTELALKSEGRTMKEATDATS